MERISSIKLEVFFAVLLILCYFMPWVDMAVLVKVVGWDIPNVGNDLSKMSSEADANVYYLYTIYVAPILALICICLSIAKKTRIARITLAISSVLAMFIAVLVYLNIPNVGYGIFMLFAIGIISSVYSFAKLLCKEA